MRILFSPIGTADPLTQLGDGPMLHIVRHCAPERVVLFLSPDIRKLQELDARYTRAIDMLVASDGREAPVVEIIESTYDQVHRFDHYISEFEDVLTTLVSEAGGEPVMVNATSGTPAMLQALVALGSFGRIPLRLLQVSTPRGGINKRYDREKPNDYDLDAMWEFNEELRREDPSALESRIAEVKTPNFANRLTRENVITLVRNYEYQAALELVGDGGAVSPEAKNLIEAARDRLNLDGGLPARAFAKSELAYKPNDILGEYLSVMEVRLEQGNYADFMRLLSPAFAQICQDVLQKNGLNRRAYLKVDYRGRLTNQLNWDAISWDSRLRKAFGMDDPRFHRADYIKSWQMKNLVEEYCDDERTVALISDLRNAEENCRNRLAHELATSSKAALERAAGLPLETILAYLFELHGNMRNHLYADISRLIVDKI